MLMSKIRCSRLEALGPDHVKFLQRLTQYGLPSRAVDAL